MKILAIEKPNPSPTDEQFTPAILRDEARTAWDLHQAGIIRELHFTADTHRAVLLLESASTAEAEQHLSQLPLVRAGLIDFEILPLAPYDGFARLFT